MKMQKLSLQTGFGEQLQGYNITFRNILQASLEYCMLYRNSSLAYNLISLQNSTLSYSFQYICTDKHAGV